MSHSKCLILNVSLKMSHSKCLTQNWTGLGLLTMIFYPTTPKYKGKISQATKYVCKVLRVQLDFCVFFPQPFSPIA